MGGKGMGGGGIMRESERHHGVGNVHVYFADNIKYE